jgi:YfiH family protein
MKRIEKNGLVFYKSSLLETYQNVMHAFFTKIGGVSLTPYLGLNLGLHTDDNLKDINENLKRVKEVLGIDTFYALHQVHGDKCLHIDDESLYYTNGYDAMITKLSNKPMLISHADCQPALFYDKKRHVLATVHSGWKGSVLNIYEKTLQNFEDLFFSKREDILVAIGPCLGPQHAEFIHFEKELPKHFWAYKDDHNRFDFWQLSFDQLTKAGIKKQHIDIARLCTYSNENEFYSFRRQHDKKKLLGANALVAFMNNQQ